MDITTGPKVLFGRGRLSEIADHLPEPSGTVAFLCGASGRAARPVADLLAQARRNVVEVACLGEPTEAQLRQNLGQLRSLNVTLIIACGGGAVIDMGKALAGLLRVDGPLSDFLDGTTVPSGVDPVPCIAIPTTAGTGAEVTHNAVISVPSRESKLSLRGQAFRPSLAIVDPDLMQGAPKPVVLGAGLDAVTQLIEAYLSCAATPYTDALVRPTLGQGMHALKRLLDAGDDTAWEDMAWASLSSGMALANGGLGVVHGLAAIIGGRFEAPHGALCGRLLVPGLRVNGRVAKPGSHFDARCRDVINQIDTVFPSDGEAMSGLTHWCADHGLPRLRDWGVTSEDHASLAADAATASSTRKNGVKLSIPQIQSILETAQ